MLLLLPICLLLVLCGFILPGPCKASNYSLQNLVSPRANVELVPKQILKTGVDLSVPTISANSRQLADILDMTSLLENIQKLRDQEGYDKDHSSAQDLSNNHLLTFNIVEAMQRIQEANLAIDFTLAEITAEENVYHDILSNFESSRDKAVFKTNAVSFITNGALWAIGEALDIPTYARPRYSVSSGSIGILAGVIPSFASMYALYQLDGKKTTSESDPNMLAKIFDCPTTPEVEYPQPVWKFLNSTPADESTNKTRRELLIDRWIADKNIPNFTGAKDKSQLDTITASRAQRKGLSIATLNLRQIMLQQLGAEVLKMKRMLLELTMVMHGEKRI